MITQSIFKAQRCRRRFSVDAAPVVVLLLSALFAVTIVSALQPHPVAEPVQASAEGGL